MKIQSKYVILCLIFFLLSFAITVQLRVTSTAESEVTQEKIVTELKDKIFELSGDNEKLGKKYEQSQQKLEEVRTKAAENDTSNIEKSNLIKKYTLIQGNTDVKGPGIMIRYYANETRSNGDAVGYADITKDLVDIVNELRNAGAEAIAVNDIRITSTSSIEMEKNNVMVDGKRIARPYVVKAIGNSEIMNSSLIRPGGTIELIKNDRARIELVIAKEVKIERAENVE